jgi:glucose/arabinose dehydrogenase
VERRRRQPVDVRNPRFAASGLATAATPLAGAACGRPVEQGPPNVPGFQPAFPEQTRAPALTSGFELAVETLASPLEHAWGVAVLPDGGFLVTERPGRLRVIAADGGISDPVAGVPEVVAEGQGGLLDVTLSPTLGAATCASRPRSACCARSRPPASASRS